MEPHIRENQEHTLTKMGDYKAGTRIGFTADENFPVFLPVRFTSMWVPDNSQIQSLETGKDHTNEMRNSADTDRHMNSRVYNPTPYCKPFAAVNTQKSPRTNSGTTVIRNKRRKMADFKEASFSVRKFKTATPYRKPTFETNPVNNEWQINTDSPLGKTITAPNHKSPDGSTHPASPTWPNISEISSAFEGLKQLSHPPPRFPVPYKKTTENTGSSHAPFVPEHFKGFDSEAIKKANVFSTTRQRFTDDLNVKKKEAVAEIERYYKHLLNTLENISKEPTQENNEVNCRDQTTHVTFGEKVTAVKESLFREKQLNNTRKSPQQAKENSSNAEDDTLDTEGSSRDSENNQCIDEQNLMERHNFCVPLMNKRNERAHSMLTIPSNILLWLFWFLKRYLFLTIILIRLFH